MKIIITLIFLFLFNTNTFSQYEKKPGIMQVGLPIRGLGNGVYTFPPIIYSWFIPISKSAVLGPYFNSGGSSKETSILNPIGLGIQSAINLAPPSSPIIPLIGVRGTAYILGENGANTSLTFFSNNTIPFKSGVAGLFFEGEVGLNSGWQISVGISSARYKKIKKNKRI